MASVRRPRMLVICPYPEGVAAGQRLKYEQYFDDWRSLGFDIIVSTYMDMAMWDVAYRKGHYPAKLFGLARGHMRRIRDLMRVARYDLVFIHMWVTPVGTSFFERMVRTLARRIIFDVEDNVILPEGQGGAENPNPLLQRMKGPGKALYMIRNADHVITSSPFLNETCLATNEKKACTYISSSVDTDRFLPATSYSNDRKVVIGWTGTFSSRPYLDLLRPVFQELARRADFRLKVIGNFDYALPGVDLEVVRWSREKEVEDLQGFDIGVYPLPMDDWVLGKSGLKAIQYMAFGLPAVATDIGTTPMLIRHGENGLLVKTQDEWLAALEALIRDPDLRRRLGVAARADAVRNYSTRAVAAQYRRVLASVMESVNG
ncbi:glycosyltransferase family 4 protein [Sphingosinicella rhizophila]|uniref:Glycosyltransferase family 4 protein n=1 Tax=Sphingosinicella rhizophila TaxID=3050082 RepID=A0ABU3Q8G0_9SPHN|nr:glycosyltransferase family 4 protein [Sphingosinicella sp. GR2756]MDT9599691.1 glycosyltransferase family 4 protein [Sphingosinicella sp. GR2756]